MTRAAAAQLERPLFDFAGLMRDLLVERGRMLLPHYAAGVQVGARDRFGQIAAMRRGGLISNLEHAKREIRSQDQ